MSVVQQIPASRRAAIGTALALAAAACYGANIPAARVVSLAGISGAELIFVRAILFGAIFLVLARLAREPLSLDRDSALATLPFATAAAFTAIFYLSSLDYLPVPIAVILFYTFPLIGMGLAAVLLRRFPPLSQMLVFAGAFAGLSIAIGPSLGGISLAGVGFALAGAFACALLFRAARTAPPTVLRTMVWCQIVALPLALGLILSRGGFAGLGALATVPVAVTLAMVGYGAGFLLQIFAARFISPARAGILFLFEPVVSIAFAAGFLDERLDGVQLLGVGIVLVAIAFEIAAKDSG
jgi:drug/metabolite transporter (DMT)-like permease